MKFELDLSNYAAKSDLKGATGIDTSKFVKKVDLSNLKSDIDYSDFDKFKTVPVDLSQLSNVEKNHVFKKTIYDELVQKNNAVQTIDTTDLVLKN